jgi:four helix bundle protein
MSVSYYKYLLVWQRGMDLVVEVYSVAKLLPKDELFALTNQIRRAAVSVPANIAEGHARLHRGDFLKHLSIARGSLSEVETHLEIACRLGYLQKTEAKTASDLIQEVGRLLNALINSLEREYNKANGSNRISEWTEPYNPSDY